MAEISLESLYGEDKNRAVGLFLLWANEVLEGFGGAACGIDDAKAYSFVVNLRPDDFPANGGFEAASPFKKAALIYVWLHALNPFESALEPAPAEGSLFSGPGAVATMVGFCLVQCCLHEATLQRTDGEKVLAMPIAVSRHFLVDLIEASRDITPVGHFKTYSLLFEALAYEANPEASYPKVMGIAPSK